MRVIIIYHNVDCTLKVHSPQTCFYFITFRLEIPIYNKKKKRTVYYKSTITPSAVLLLSRLSAPFVTSAIAIIVFLSKPSMSFPKIAYRITQAINIQTSLLFSSKVTLLSLPLKLVMPFASVRWVECKFTIPLGVSVVTECECTFRFQWLDCITLLI